MLKTSLICLSIICLCPGTVNAAATIIRGFLQTNVVGLPVIHDQQIWEFDPDISLRRRKQFEELNGIKAEKLIERLGLGIDGFADERLRKQQIRDEGHLQGLDYINP